MLYRVGNTYGSSVGYGIGKKLQYFARFFTAASTWVGNLLKSSTSELYIEPTGRNCYDSTNTDYCTLSNYILNSVSKWSVYFSINETTTGTGAIFGVSTGFYPSFWERYDNFSFRSSLGTYYSFNYAVVDGDYHIISDDTNVYLFKNSILVSTVTPNSTTMSVNVIAGYYSGAVVNFVGKMNDFKSKDLSSYTGDFTPEAIDALGWDHHFPLDQWKAGSTPPSVRYSDVTGGITSTLVNGTVPDNLGARSDNSKSYNWNGFTLDGDEYVPAKDDGSGLDVDGNPLTNPALNNGSAHNGNEQKMRFTTVPQELIDIDVDNQFQVAGVATEWYPQDVTADYIEKTQDESENVKKLEIIKNIY